MKEILAADHVGVFDDVLPGELLAELHDWLGEGAALRFVNQVEVQNVWSVADGHPMATPSLAVQAERSGAGALRPASDVPALDGPTIYGYPSDSPVDRVIDWLLERADRFSRWIGPGGAADGWRTLHASGYVYPYGTGLDWHLDDQHYAGAFTLYVHPQWKTTWAGELLVASPPFDKEQSTQTGAFVAPRSNRLVILRGGTPHKISRVSPLAGENFRRSIAGFFDRRTIAEVLGET